MKVSSGFLDVPQFHVVDDTDLAEHVPGTPQRFKHGWIPLVPGEEISKVEKVAKAKVIAKKARKAASSKMTKTDRMLTRRELRKHPVATKNVLDMWSQATPEEKVEGENWYAAANDVADALAKKYKLTPHQAAGIIATYSPQTGWGTNLIRAAIVMRTKKGIGGKGSGVMATAAQKAAADRILAGEDYNTVLKGRKINNFANLIEHGGDVPGEGRVVMDRHAIGVTRGIPLSEDQYTIDRPASAKRYEMMSNAYREAAAELTKTEGRPISPHMVQAATWLARQRLNKAASRGKARNSRGVNDWNDWLDTAAKIGVASGGAGTGYELAIDVDFEQLYGDTDLAEHLAGEPYRYKHGWVPVGPLEAIDPKTAKSTGFTTSEAFHNASARKADQTYRAALAAAHMWPDPAGDFSSASELKPGTPERAWAMYQCSPYEQINLYLRTGKKTRMPGYTSDEFDAEVESKALLKAFDTMGVDTPKPLKFYRGLSNGGLHNWDKEIEVGQTYQDKGAVSTASSLPGVIDFLEYNNEDHYNGAAILEIHAPKGTRVLPGTYAADETIMKPGTKFRVLSKKKRTDGRTLFVVEVVK